MILFTIDKAILKRARGEVGLDRRRNIAAKIQQGLANRGVLAGEGIDIGRGGRLQGIGSGLTTEPTEPIIKSEP